VIRRPGHCALLAPLVTPLRASYKGFAANFAFSQDAKKASVFALTEDERRAFLNLTSGDPGGKKVEKRGEWLFAANEVVFQTPKPSRGRSSKTICVPDKSARHFLRVLVFATLESISF